MRSHSISAQTRRTPTQEGVLDRMRLLQAELAELLRPAADRLGTLWLPRRAERWRPPVLARGGMMRILRQGGVLGLVVCDLETRGASYQFEFRWGLDHLRWPALRIDELPGVGPLLADRAASYVRDHAAQILSLATARLASLRADGRVAPLPARAAVQGVERLRAAYLDRR